MKRYCICAFFIFILFDVVAQNQNPTAKVLLDSARQIGFSDISKSKQLFEKAKKEQPKGSEFYYYILMIEAGFYDDLGEFDIANALSDSLINQSKFKRYQGLGLKERGIIASMKNEVDVAIVSLKEAIEIFEEIEDPIEVATCLKVLGNTLFFSENLGEARAYYKRSAKISLDAGDPIATGLAYNNISRTFEDSKYLDSAIYYNNKIFNLLEKERDYRGELNFMVYLNDADYQSRKGNFQKAKISIDSSFKIAQELKIPAMLGAVHQVNAANLKLEKNYAASLAEAEKAMEIFQQNNQPNYYKQTLYIAQEGAAKIKDFERAYHLLLEYQTINDSINVIEVDKNLKDLRIKYEAAEKELKIVEQQAEIAQKENQRKTLFMMSIALGLLVLLGFLFFRQRQKTQKQEIVSLKNEKENVALRSLMAGEEKERSRIAKELHDGLGGVLAAAKMHLSKMKGSNDEASQKAMDLLDTASKESRRISHNLLPETLMKKGLDAALQDFINSINESGLLKAEYQSIHLKDNLPQPLQLSVYRIIQELINNIIKHSEATQALVQIQQEPSKLTVTVEDNGKGFAHESTSKGIGLQNIESRLSLLKGKLEIDSEEKTGTSVYIELELEK